MGLDAILRPINEWIVWYSGVPLMFGLLLAAVDLLLFFPSTRQPSGVQFDPVSNQGVTGPYGLQ